MIVPLETHEHYMTPEQKELMYWDELKFNTHRWVEQPLQGYYKCSFCEKFHTSTTPINLHSVCKKNEYLDKVIKPSVLTGFNDQKL
jgi:hypothetical protein